MGLRPKRYSRSVAISNRIAASVRDMFSNRVSPRGKVASRKLGRGFPFWKSLLFTERLSQYARLCKYTMNTKSGAL